MSIDKLFHGGYLYVLASTFFAVATIIALYYLRRIHNTLTERRNKDDGHKNHFV